MSDKAHHRARQLGALPEFLESRGAVPRQVLDRAGLTQQMISDPDAVVVRAQVATALAGAGRQLGEYRVGLEYAMAMGPDELRSSARVAPQCLTLRDGLTSAARLTPLFHSHTEAKLVEGPSTASYVFDLSGSDPQFVADFSEASMAVVARAIRECVGPEWVPMRVEFKHKARSSVAAYEDFFKAPVLFNAAQSVITFEAEVLKSPIGRAMKDNFQDPGRKLQSLGTEPERWFDGDRLVGHLELVIDGMLASKYLSCHQAGRTLGMPQRTLQHRLAQLGLSFQYLVDKRRRLAAEKYLGDHAVGVTEVAFMLGYDDAAHFARAFKRWTGLSPRGYRRQAENEPAEPQVAASPARGARGTAGVKARSSKSSPVPVACGSDWAAITP